MRILITSRGSSGHLTPIAPFAHAALRAGHEVLAAVQEAHQPNARRLGLPSTPVPAAPPEVWRPRMAAMMESSFDEANRAMLTEYFGRLDTEHALPALRRIVREWRPDVIVRESWEFASTLVGEMLGVPVVRVGLGDRRRSRSTATASWRRCSTNCVRSTTSSRIPTGRALRGDPVPHDGARPPRGPRGARAGVDPSFPASRPRRRARAPGGLVARASTTRRSSTRRSGP